MSSLLNTLLGKFKGGYWLREKYNISSGWDQVGSIVSSFTSTISNIEKKLDDLSDTAKNLKSSIDDIKTNFENDASSIIITSLSTVQSLYAINSAYNSKKYVGTAALANKADSINISDPLGTFPARLQRQFSIRVDLGQIVNENGIKSVPELIGYKVVKGKKIYNELPPPETYQEVIEYIRKITLIFLEWEGVNTQYKEALSYWITASVTKSLNISGGIISRYKSASHTFALIGEPSEAGNNTIAWHALKALIDVAVSVGLLIVRLIKQAIDDDDDKSILTQFVILCSQDKFKVVIGDFPTNNEQQYIAEVQRILGVYETGFALKNGIATFGVTRFGKVEKKTLLALYKTYMAQLHISAENFITMEKPKFIDLEL